MTTTAQPDWIEPMLATLVEPVALPDGWLYEPKLDGVRCLAFIRPGRIRLLSRNRKPLDGAYPEIVDALAPAVGGSAVLDGEIVAIDPERGVSSFSLLQRRSGFGTRPGRGAAACRWSSGSSTACSGTVPTSAGCRWWSASARCARS